MCVDAPHQAVRYTRSRLLLRRRSAGDHRPVGAELHRSGFPRQSTAPRVDDHAGRRADRRSHCARHRHRARQSCPHRRQCRGLSRDAGARRAVRASEIAPRQMDANDGLRSPSPLDAVARSSAAALIDDDPRPQRLSYVDARRSEGTPAISVCRPCGRTWATCRRSGRSSVPPCENQSPTGITASTPSPRSSSHRRWIGTSCPDRARRSWRRSRHNRGRTRATPRWSRTS